MEISKVSSNDTWYKIGMLYIICGVVNVSKVSLLTLLVDMLLTILESREY